MREQNNKCHHFFLLITLCLALSIVFPQKALSWGAAAHRSTASDAYQICFYNFLKQRYPDTQHVFIRAVQEAVLKPDKYRGNANHVNISECAWKTKKMAKKCEKMLKENDNWADIIVAMGETSHFIQDMNCPHHGIGYVKKGHGKFEQAATYGFWSHDKFDGFQYVENYKILIYNAARHSKRYIKFDKPPFYSDREYYLKVMEPLWDHTVNDIIDLWLTILYNGLGKERYRSLGFPENEGTRADAKIKYPKITIP